MERSIFELLKNTVLAIQFWQCTYRDLLSSLDIMNNNAGALYNQMLEKNSIRMKDWCECNKSYAKTGF